MVFVKLIAPPIEFKIPKIMTPHTIKEMRQLESVLTWHRTWAEVSNEKRNRLRHAEIAIRIEEALCG